MHARGVREAEVGSEDTGATDTDHGVEKDAGIGRGVAIDICPADIGPEAATEMAIDADVKNARAGGQEAVVLTGGTRVIEAEAQIGEEDLGGRNAEIEKDDSIDLEEAGRRLEMLGKKEIQIDVDGQLCMAFRT